MPTRPEPGSPFRALIVRSHEGAARSLQLGELPTPELRRGQVLIRVAAAPVNPNDLLALRNAYDVPKKLGTAAGFEGSGTVVAAQGAIARPMIGRRVAFSAAEGSGSWAQYAVAESLKCAPLRPFVSDEEGATMLTNPLTASVLVEQARRERHRAVIQAAAAGALGKMVARLALEQNLPMIHLVRSEAQVAALKALGAQTVLDTGAPRFQHQLAEESARLGATLAFDPVAGTMTGVLLKALQPGGVVRTFGWLSGAPSTFDPNEVVFQRKRIEGFTMYQWLKETSLPRQLLAVIRAQSRLRGPLSTEVREKVPLDGFQAALEDYERNMSAGKTLFVP